MNKLHFLDFGSYFSPGLFEFTFFKTDETDYSEAWRKELQRINPVKAQPEETNLWAAYQKLSEIPGLDKILENIEPPVRFLAKADHPIQETVDELERDTAQPNLDLPSNLSFVAQGITEHRNEHLDCSQIGRIFREWCVNYNYTNYFLKEKRAADFQGLQNQRYEWIVAEFKKLRKFIEAIDAQSIAKSLSQLGLNYKATNKSLFGMARKTGYRWFNRKGPRKVTTGIINSKKDFSEIALYLENLVETLETPSDQLEDLRQYYYDVSCRLIEAGQLDGDPVLQMHYIERMAKETLDEEESPNPGDVDRLIEFGFDPSEDTLDEYEAESDILDPSDDPMFDIHEDGNPFSANALFDGREGLTTEFINKIKTASLTELNIIQAKMFKPMDENNRPLPWRDKTGKWTWFGYFTKGQKDMVWEFINARKAELRRQARTSPKFKEIAGWIRQFGKGVTTCQIIKAWQEGGKYDLYGEAIEFDGVPNNFEIKEAWKLYRALAA